MSDRYYHLPQVTDYQYCSTTLFSIILHPLLHSSLSSPIHALILLPYYRYQGRGGGREGGREGTWGNHLGSIMTVECGWRHEAGLNKQTLVQVNCGEAVDPGPG